MVKRTRPISTVTASSKDQRSADKELGVTSALADRDESLSNGDEATKQAPLYDNIHDLKQESSRRYGPTKAATNIRTITEQDFQPDVCKHFKRSGFCGFGDNCKFLHAREDYKQSWELDQDWDASTQGRSPSGTVVGARNKDAHDDGDLYDLSPRERKPPTCGICEEVCQTSVVTRCGHFCEDCALTRYKRNPTCATCSAALDGTFSAAKVSR